MPSSTAGGSRLREPLSVHLADADDGPIALAALADLTAGERPQLDPDGGAIRLAVTDPAASAEAIRRLDARRLPILAVDLQEPSLDDVFLTLTGHPTDESPNQEAA